MKNIRNQKNEQKAGGWLKAEGQWVRVGLGAAVRTL